MYRLGNNNEDINIILADDHEVVRTGLRRLLIIDKNIKILGEATNGLEAIELVKMYNPQIAFLDILMPKMDGIEAATVLKAKYPDVLIIFLTAFEDYIHLEKALNAGADGYLTKDVSAKSLVEAIYKVLNGERVFSRTILELVQKKIPTGNEEYSHISITRREQQILNLVSDGLTSEEIAERLKISIRTVHSHRANLLHKLGLKTAAGLIRYGVMRANELNKEK